MSNAFLINIEGSDASGKETQTALLKEYLIRSGKTVADVSFPRYKKTVAGWGLFEAIKGENRKAYNFANLEPYAASMQYAQDRRESLPYLQTLIAEHDYVLLDRYVPSNLIHQGGKFKTDEEKEVFADWLIPFEHGTLELPLAHSTIYLELPYEVFQRRAHHRALLQGSELDAVEKDIEYAKNGYYSGLFYAKRFNWKTIKCVKDDGYELTREEVHLLIMEKLREDLVIS